jgi:hypothetical protein
MRARAGCGGKTEKAKDLNPKVSSLQPKPQSETQHAAPHEPEPQICMQRDIQELERTLNLESSLSATVLEKKAEGGMEDTRVIALATTCANQHQA